MITIKNSKNINQTNMLNSPNKISSYVVLITLALIWVAGAALGQSTNFIHYDTEDGLPQSQVQTIQQDNDGNLWIGTMSGLARYDGKTFYSYTTKDSLAEDWITTSYKDKVGDIWLGHWGGGVSKYVFSTKTFINLDFDIISQFNPITVIYQDNSGNFWFGTDGGGIYRYSTLNNTVYVITSDEELSGDYVTSICEDNEGNLWIGTNNGITIYNTAEAINAEEGYSYLNVEKGLINNKITDIKHVLDNEIWIATEDAGIVIIRLIEGESFMNVENIHDAITANLSVADGLASNSISHIYQDDLNNIWISTANGGVTQFIPENQSRMTEASLVVGVFKTFSTKEGLNYNKVNGVLQDREGNYWIGTEIGLNQYRSDRFQVFDESDGLANNIIWAINEDSQGNIWLGTNAGVSKISPNTASGSGVEVTNYTTADGLADDIVLSICEDSEGNIWFGTASKGVSRMSPEGGFKTFDTDDGLAGNSVYSISQGSGGDVWFGTKEGASKYIQGTFTSYTSRDGLGGDNIYRVFNDSKGNIWFGILGGTLSMYDGSNFKTFAENPEVNNKFALSIAEDNSGNIWLGIYGTGLFKYNGSSFTHFGKDEGLSTESPSLIVLDNDDNVWIGSSKGLDKLNQESGKVTNYGKKEGFLGVETNANSVCKAQDGSLWIGSIMGVVKYDPSKDNPNTIAPITYISNTKIKLKDVELADGAVYLYDQNHFTFSYHGISLTNPEAVMYSYKLEGFDEEWSPPSKESFATYSNLPHGSFKFLLKASNGEGVWSEPTTSASFSITPPFWKTIWFYITCVILGLAGVFVFDKVRTANLKREKRVLEEKVEERTIELAHKNEELAEKNEDITASIRYAKRIQRAILPPVSVITKHFPESFIYFRPKDIVSGDFYWMEETNGKLLFTAVDCTGHGVPGAFMSIIGFNILDDLVNKRNMTKPSDILDHLSQGVYDTLRQSTETDETEDQVRDAMDLAFCTIDLKTNTLEYAAAYNPLYIVRNNEVLETKADRKAIGAIEEGEGPYTNHEIKLQKGDAIYIFSDGYVDQFGGQKGKKYMSKRFKQLFLDAQDMKMADQEKHIDESLKEWQGDRDQVDDVLVMGIKV